MNQKELKRLLHYNYTTGNFTWLVNRGGGARAGDQAGTLCHGYVVIRISGKGYQAARLAWLYVKGRWPTHEVDHKDLDTTNNRWRNLRHATHGQNQQNSRMQKRNTSGYKGVGKFNNKYQAHIRVNGKKIHLGTFNTAQRASSAYRAAALKYHGQFARII